MQDRRVGGPALALSRTLTLTLILLAICESSDPTRPGPARPDPTRPGPTMQVRAWLDADGPPDGLELDVFKRQQLAQAVDSADVMKVLLSAKVRVRMHMVYMHVRMTCVSAARHGTAWHSMAQHGTAQHGTA